MDLKHFKKLADLKANMAKRIFFSTLSSLVGPGNSAQIPLTHGAVDIIALRQMIPGAKELLEYGIQAAIDEAKEFHQKNVVDELLKIANQGNPDQTLKALINMFNRDDWRVMFGGKHWAKISQTLLEIHKYLEAAKNFRRTDPEQELKSLMEMTAYLNVLDGLAHNTGSIYGKMLAIQNQKYDSEYGENELNRLMDAKELKDSEDVIAEIFPTLQHETDASLTMKDWFSKARQQSHFYQNNAEARQEQLKKIRMKKELLQSLNNYELPYFKKDLESWMMLPDNVLLSRAIQAAPRFGAIVASASNALRSPAFPNNLRDSMVLKLRAAKKLSNYNMLPLDKYKENLVSLPLYMVRKMVEDSLDLISLLEQGIEKITD